jgi:hypothetical protein
MPKIYYRIAWSSEKDLVSAYNSEMELIPNDDDYCAFVDRDAMFCHPLFGKCVEQVIETYPECSCFTGVTAKEKVHALNNFQHSHIPSPMHLRITNFMDLNDDIFLHSKHAIDVWNDMGTSIVDISNPDQCHFAGFLIVIKKSLWRKIGGFKAWNESSKILGVDSRLHQDIYEHGEKLYVMNGIYLYHYYRGNNPKDVSHLK